MEDRAKEVWKSIPNFPLGYQVSNWGRVTSLKNKGQFLRPQQKSRCGSLKVRLFKEQREYSKVIHVLVARAFVPNPDPLYLKKVKHLDGDMTNNYFKNLEWF